MRYNKYVKRILVLPLYGIGDVLMTTPALRNLKEQLEVEITYLHMFETTRDILRHNPYVDHNVYFPFLKATKISGIRFLMDHRKRYDCSINFYPSNRRDYNLAAFIAGSRMRIGHRYVQKNLSELNFLKNRTLREDDCLHNVEENLRLLDFLGVTNTKLCPLEIYLTEEESDFADRWLNEKGIKENMLIGIHHGASTFKNHDKKRWPEVSFAKLIDALAGKLKHSVFVLFGGPEEKSSREAVISLINNKKRVLSVDSVTVRQAAALMKKCSLFISNDSGPMHMAATVGVPTVAIFGPTNPVWVKPWWVKHKTIRLGLPCSPCFRYSPTPLNCVANIDFACLKNIDVDQVYEACLDLLIEAGN